MKFFCDNCKAKYQIGDEKVAGKTIRMKCRKCGHQIEVRQGSPNVEAPSVDASFADSVATSGAPSASLSSASLAAVAGPLPSAPSAPAPAPKAAFVPPSGSSVGDASTSI